MEKEVNLTDVYLAYQEYLMNCVAYENGDYTYLYDIQAKQLQGTSYTLKRSGKNDN